MQRRVSLDLCLIWSLQVWKSNSVWTSYSVRNFHFQMLQKTHLEGGAGRQELCPNSGVFIPAIKAVHQKAGFDLKVLFHKLVDHFFSEDELGTSIAFGTRQVPPNTSVLNPVIVCAIQDKNFIMACITETSARCD